jgi:hypothetical protein
MPNFHFPGFPTYLQAAATELGRPELAEPARRIPALSRMADLCAQAAEADPAHIGAILRAASEFRDQIRIARLAADRMIAAARVAAGLPAETPEPVPSRPIPLTAPPAAARPARQQGRS